MNLVSRVLLSGTIASILIGCEAKKNVEPQEGATPHLEILAPEVRELTPEEKLREYQGCNPKIYILPPRIEGQEYWPDKLNEQFKYTKPKIPPA